MFCGMHRSKQSKINKYQLTNLITQYSNLCSRYDQSKPRHGQPSEGVSVMQGECQGLFRREVQLHNIIKGEDVIDTNYKGVPEARMLTSTF